MATQYSKCPLCLRYSFDSAMKKCIRADCKPDGTPVTRENKLEIEAVTLDEARANVKQRLLTLTDSEKTSAKEMVLSAEGVKYRRESGQSDDQAFANAIRFIPDKATVIERKIVSPAQVHILNIEAFDELEARAIAENRKQEGYTVTVIEQCIAAKKGFFGIGKRPGKFQVNTIKSALVEVIYREPAKILLTWLSTEYIKAVPPSWQPAAQVTQSKSIVNLFIMTNREIPSAWRDNYLNQILKLHTEYGSYEALTSSRTRTVYVVAGEIDFSDISRVCAELLISGNVSDPNMVERLTFGNFSDGKGLRGRIVAEFNQKI